MKIAHLVSRFLPYRGGITNIVFNYARELSLIGHEIVVFTPNHDRKTHPEDKENPFTVQRMKPWIKCGNAGLVPQILPRLSSFDIIHIHYPFFGGAEWVPFLKWVFLSPPKIVLSYHMDVLGEGFLKLFFRGYAKSFLPFLIQQSDLILAATQDYAETSLISKYIKKKPFLVLPYGVSPEFKPLEKNQKLMLQFNISPGDPILLFVGGLDRAHYFKGVPVLIEAVSKLDISNLKLLIVGNGDLIPVFKAQIRKQGMQNQISIVTGVGNSELPDYYNLADMVILPSTDRSESFGLVLLEAMACGKPVIGSSLPGIRTIIEGNKNGLLVRPGDPGDLAEKIQFLLDHKEVCGQYGLSGLKKVEEQFHWNQIIRQVDRAYHEVKSL